MLYLNQITLYHDVSEDTKYLYVIALQICLQTLCLCKLPLCVLSSYKWVHHVT